MKSSAAEIGGVWHDVSKTPATDLAKASKAWRLSLGRDLDGRFATIRTGRLDGRADLLGPGFRDARCS